MSSSSLYASIRAAVQETGSDSRVEVNQRALIDKILARYASAGAVYRELLQNSNDAEATMAEIYFTTADHSSKTVQQVLYRNNGMPFRPQDWSRLQKVRACVRAGMHACMLRGYGVLAASVLLSNSQVEPLLSFVAKSRR